MNLSQLSIRRPVFIACIVALVIVVGGMSMLKLSVDNFPNVTFPFVLTYVTYPGAGPAEMETLVSKPIEEELSTISGMKKVSSNNMDGYATIWSEFELEVDVKDAEQQVRDRIAGIRKKLPKDIEEPVIWRYNPADASIMTYAVEGDLSSAELYDVADQLIKPRLERISQVSKVDIVGGRKREIQVQLNRKKMADYEITASQVAERLGMTGENIPVGKSDISKKEVVYRAMGQFPSINKIKSVVLKFYGNDVPILVKDLGQVVDTQEDEKTRVYVNGKKTLILEVSRQSGANTVEIADAVKRVIPGINADLASRPGSLKVTLVRDGARPIRNNLFDVRDSIVLGVILAIFVVFLFLGNFRSTLITGVALPNSLIGAFIFIAASGFTINTLSLLGLSLVVGLLVDDAIVVRENIFRHMELGKSPKEAAEQGTREVTLAVIATTLTIVAVFGSIAFVGGITGRFMREFGLTVCYAMAVSLFDGLAVAPMLSAYFSGRSHSKGSTSSGGWMERAFVHIHKGQDWLEHGYATLLARVQRRPLTVIIISVLIFILGVSTVMFIPKTFIPAADSGELVLEIDMKPGTTLEHMQTQALRVYDKLKTNPLIDLVRLRIGTPEGISSEANFFIRLVPQKNRHLSTSAMKDQLRLDMASFSELNPRIKDYDMTFGGLRPFTLNFIGTDIDVLEKTATQFLVWMKKHRGLKDADVNFRSGKPEFQIQLDEEKVAKLGVSTQMVGGELRAQIEGVVPAKFRQDGLEYDVRVRLQEDERDLAANFSKTLIPNINYRLLPLASVATPKNTEGLTSINRQNRSRYVQVSADLNEAAGAGIGDLIEETKRAFQTDFKLPPGVTYSFEGQGEEFAQMASNMMIAAALAVLFIFLVLASLYDSWITPFAIMLALPLAVCGAFIALWIGGQSLNLFSMIACIMLLGVATKNSILLVDYTGQLERNGMPMQDALVEAGRRRLRPILMTSMALIAGALPIAIGLSEVSKQRESMGFAMIGGVISSTLLTLIVVPAAYAFIERFRKWSGIR